MEKTMRAQDAPLLWRGRTLWDSGRDAVFFNWSGSGFEADFSGTRLTMEVEAFKDTMEPEGDSLPCLTVAVDGDWEGARRVPLREGVQRVDLLELPSPDRHRVCVVKLSENGKGRNCLRALTMEGELARPPEDGRPLLEFVGDSITCGFGNEQRPEELFSTRGENALESYAAHAAALLGCRLRMVCVSGIPLCWSPDPERHIRMPMPPHLELPRRTMEDLYPLTDGLQARADGVQSPQRWDFARDVPAAIVINLGTNDAFRLSVTPDHRAEERHFAARYRAFLETVRRLNGPGPVIACTLGPMNYYLYDTIVRTAEEYRRASGDGRVFCMKYGAIDLWTEGTGGAAHPSAPTHRRMGRELSRALRPWLAGAANSRDRKEKDEWNDLDG